MTTVYWMPFLISCPVCTPFTPHIKFAARFFKFSRVYNLFVFDSYYFVKEFCPLSVVIQPIVNLLTVTTLKLFGSCRANFASVLNRVKSAI